MCHQCSAVAPNQKWRGHKSVVTTTVYPHVDIDIGVDIGEYRGAAYALL